jgi:hypothetical protein
MSPGKHKAKREKEDRTVNGKRKLISHNTNIPFVTDAFTRFDDVLVIINLLP